MMNKVEMLDCTLRDGAYIVNAEFGTAAIKGIMRNMQDANIKIIECGWLKNTEHILGTTFYHVPDDLKRYIVQKRSVCSAWFPECDRHAAYGVLYRSGCERYGKTFDRKLYSP